MNASGEEYPRFPGCYIEDPSEAKAAGCPARQYDGLEGIEQHGKQANNAGNHGESPHRSSFGVSSSRHFLCRTFADTVLLRLRTLPGARSSDSPVVCAPTFDAFFDLLSGQIFFKCLLCQGNHLVIRGKTQAYQLALGEPVDLRVPLDWGKSLQAQPFLKPDDAVLHLERVAAKLDKWDEYDERQHQEPCGRDARIRPMANQVEDGEDQVGNQNEGENKVVGRVETLMTLEALRVCFTHACP